MFGLLFRKHAMFCFLFILLQFEMRSENVQLLAGMFLSNTNQGQVNYEKILSFISAAMKEKYVLGQNLEL